MDASARETGAGAAGAAGAAGVAGFGLGFAAIAAGEGIEAGEGAPAEDGVDAAASAVVSSGF
ncbi:hypothetical protein GCM10028789_23170 [Sinomonas halotolerans]